MKSAEVFEFCQFLIVLVPRKEQKIEDEDEKQARMAKLTIDQRYRRIAGALDLFTPADSCGT